MLADGLPEQPRPAVLSRTDGVALFYPGEVNLLFGDPEHGKTWVGLAACAETLRKGGRVLVVDIDHNGSLAIIANLLLLGVPQEVISDPNRFRHCEPTDVDSVMRVVRDCGDWTPQVVLIDSTGELLPLFGASSDSADDFTRVHNRVLQPLASTGAVVVLIDHLAKGKESRTFGPTGSMAKRRTVGGVSLRVVRDAVFARGRGGSARLWVNKDRHSGVFMLPVVNVWAARERARCGDRDGALPQMRSATDDLFHAGHHAYGIPATGFLVETLLARSAHGDVAEAEAAIDRLAAALADKRLVIRDVWLLQMRALLARAQGDDTAYRDYRDRYREIARTLGFEGHMKWAEAMP